MPPSDDPNSAALDYIGKITGGQTIQSAQPLGQRGGFNIKLSDGTYIAYRPAGMASSKTLPSTANVDINNVWIKMLNGAISSS
jgi:filamentous hemagglutinin